MASIQYYDVILKPLVTEKSMSGMGDKKYTFLVHPEANKSMIKEAVEKMFPGTKDQAQRHDLRQDRKAEKGHCPADRGLQGDRDLPGPVKIARNYTEHPIRDNKNTALQFAPERTKPVLNRPT